MVPERIRTEFCSQTFTMRYAAQALHALKESTTTTLLFPSPRLDLLHSLLRGIMWILKTYAILSTPSTTRRRLHRHPLQQLGGAEVVVPHAAAARPVIVSKTIFKEHPSVCVCVCARARARRKPGCKCVTCASYYKKTGSGMRLSLLLHTHIVGRTHSRPPSVAKSNDE